MFRSGMHKIPKIRGKRVFSLSFLDPSSPRLASGSRGPANYFKVKEPARLGELVTSGVSINSPRRAAISPSAHFPINRRAWEAEGRFQGLEVERIERRRRKKRKRSGGAAES